MGTARQQINLLQEQLRDRKPVLPATHVLGYIALAAVLCLASAIWYQTSSARSSHALQQLQAQLEQRQQVLFAISETITSIDPDPGLKARLLRSEQELERLRLVTRVAHQLTPTKPLSEFVAGFGRQRPIGLWLANLHIGLGGADLVLQGHTTDAGLLPDYIAALGTEPVFEGLRFGQLSMERTDENTLWLDFRVVAGCRNGSCPQNAGGAQ